MKPRYLLAAFYDDLYALVDLIFVAAQTSPEPVIRIVD
jgi:hypothetical protein